MRLFGPSTAPSPLPAFSVPALLGIGMVALAGCSYNDSSDLSSPPAITLRYSAADRAAAEQSATHQCAFDGKRAAYKETATEQGAPVLVYECR